MGILIDIILIAILLISAFSGYKRGLVKLGAKLFAGIIAIVVTLILYRPIAGAIIKNTTLDEKIQNIIIENASNFGEDSNKDNNITEQLTNEVKNQMIPQEAEKIAISAIYAITSVVLFVVVKIILSIVISLIDGIARLPILKQFNEIGGMAYGILRGILIVFIVILLMGVYTKIKPESTLNYNIQKSYITKTINEKIIKI